MSRIPKRLEDVHANLMSKYRNKRLYSYADLKNAIDEIEAVDGLWARWDSVGDDAYWIYSIDYIPSDGAVGRPASNEPKDQWVNMRMTYKEKQKISNEAHENGMAVSNYIHFKLFGGEKIE